MLTTTRGIVLHALRYSETSLIAKVYTASHGMQGYMLKGIRSQKSAIRPALFQPMNLLELVVYHKEKQTLHSVKEARMAHPYSSIPFDMRKSSVAMFCNELIYKTIREEEANPELFEFLWDVFITLDTTGQPVSMFPLLFALRYSRFLGFFPLAGESEEGRFFNLREGTFQESVPDHPQYLSPEYSLMLRALLDACDPDDPDVKTHCNASLQYPGLTSAIRSGMLEVILLYYQLHLPGFRGVQSHHILHDVLS